MIIKGQDYYVSYDSVTVTVKFQGTLRLRELSEYDPIEQMLYGVVADNPKELTLNLQELEYLNSSGITMLSLFLYKLSQSKDTVPIIQISQQFSWHRRAFKNMQQLVPALKFEMA